MQLLSQLLSRFLPLWIIVCTITAYFFPGIFAVLGGSTSFLLGFVIFLTGLSMSLEHIKLLKSSIHIIIFGLSLKWIFTVGFSIVLAYFLFSSEPQLAAGIILSASVPTGTAATMYTFLAGGNTPLIIIMSIIEVFISPVLTPAIMQTFTIGNVEVSFADLGWNMLLIVIFPVLCGILVQKLSPFLVTVIQPYTRLSSSTALLLIVLTVVSETSGEIQTGEPWFYLLCGAVFLQVFVPMAAGYRLTLWCGFSRENAKAILFEAGLCNSALAAILALEFIGEAAAIPAMINMVFNLSLGALFANVFSRSLSIESKKDFTERV
ncbi:bile acid:sodium symporter family protein [Alteribacillus sp. HJP-4]|uniref:bile acid:sodium symporter family protein n=1 Tax=Alteribacillus sp. HJP-4 TaxID=2775394 RepID=UPI0035CCF731